MLNYQRVPRIREEQQVPGVSFFAASHPLGRAAASRTQMKPVQPARCWVLVQTWVKYMATTTDGSWNPSVFLRMRLGLWRIIRWLSSGSGNHLISKSHCDPLPSPEQRLRIAHPDQISVANMIFVVTKKLPIY